LGCKNYDDESIVCSKLVTLRNGVNFAKAKQPSSAILSQMAIIFELIENNINFMKFCHKYSIIY